MPGPLPTPGATVSGASLEAVEIAPAVQEILDTIRATDPMLAQEVEDSVRHCIAATTDLGRLHLPQDQFEEGAVERPQDDKHLELAPYVLGAIASVNRLLRYLVDTFPAPPDSGEEQAVDDDDFDFEFDLVDEPGPGAGAKSTAAEPKTQSPREQVCEAAHAYGGMLRSRVVNFGERLVQALEQPGSWPLLAELDDYKHRLAKAVQGLLFGVLEVFSSSHEIKREEIFPEYRSAVSQGVALRSVVADLAYHVSRFNAALAEADPDTAVPLVVGVADRLARFCGRVEYRMLRADDKKAVLDFRRELYRLRHVKKEDGGGIPMGPLRLAVEGFSKFLESLQAINHREVLILHDRKLLEEALGQLQYIAQIADTDSTTARSKMDELVETLGAARGRNPELDEKLRTYQGPEQVPDDVSADVGEWMPVLQQVLMTVG